MAYTQLITQAFLRCPPCGEKHGVITFRQPTTWPFLASPSRSTQHMENKDGRMLDKRTYIPCPSTRTINIARQVVDRTFIPYCHFTCQHPKNPSHMTRNPRATHAPIHEKYPKVMLTACLPASFTLAVRVCMSSSHLR